jgi:hypothetical protein
MHVGPAYSAAPTMAGPMDSMDTPPRTHAVRDPRKSAVATKHAAGVRYSPPWPSLAEPNGFQQRRWGAAERRRPRPEREWARPPCADTSKTNLAAALAPLSRRRLSNL